MKLPPRPKVPALVSRTLLATALAAPACGSNPPQASRIGPPPCYERVGIVATVVTEQGELLTNQAVTVSDGKLERVLSTDESGRFELPDDGGLLRVTVPGYETIEQDRAMPGCWEPGSMRVVVRATAEPAQLGGDEEPGVPEDAEPESP